MDHKILISLVETALLILILELIFWNITDYVIFNDYALNTDLTILYYCSASILGLIFSALLMTQPVANQQLISKLLALFAAIFITVSLIQSYVQYCNDYKNMDVIFVIINYAINALSVLLLIKYFTRIPSSKGRIVLITSYVILILDMNYLMIGFSLFY